MKTSQKKKLKHEDQSLRDQVLFEPMKMEMNLKKTNMTSLQIVDHLSIRPDSTAQVGFQIDILEHSDLMRL